MEQWLTAIANQVAFAIEAIALLSIAVSTLVAFARGLPSFFSAERT